MFSAYKKFWTHYVDFSGKSSRSDFWWVFLCQFLIYLIFGIFIIGSIFPPLFAALANGSSSDYMASLFQSLGSILFVLILVSLFGLATTIPYYAPLVRRLRDAGYHWAFVFLTLGPTLLSWLVSEEAKGTVVLLGFVTNAILLILLAMPTKDMSQPFLVEFQDSTPEKTGQRVVKLAVPTEEKKTEIENLE